MTNHQLWLMPSAFGDSGGTGAKPPFPASAADAPASSTTSALTMATMCLPKRTVRAFYERGRGAAPSNVLRLPADVERPFEVYLNGVPQHEGDDYVVRDGMLVFERPLAKEKVGVGRWTSMVLGIAGSYGKDDSVDVAYRSGGRSKVAAKLRFEVPTGLIPPGLSRRNASATSASHGCNGA